MSAKKSNKKLFRILAIAGVLVAVLLVAVLYFLKSNATNLKAASRIRVHKNQSLENVADVLVQKAALKNRSSFLFWAKLLNYKIPEACAFSIRPGDGLWDIIKGLKLHANRYTNITLNGSASAKSIARNLAARIETDSVAFMDFVNSASMNKFGADAATWYCLLLPNTYNVKCSEDLNGFFGKMKEAYNKFWTKERLEKAQKQGLTPEQVVTIASIVTKESNQYEEYQNIAGVYINRYRKNMLLQADPTVNFARGRDGNPSKADLQRDHPYNTYVKKGLPPGPICIPNLQSIEATLDYKGHDYIFFCAKPELNGLHNFAVTYEEHLKNVKLYRDALSLLKKKNTTASN